MAKTTTKEKVKVDPIAPQAPTGSVPAASSETEAPRGLRLRIPYPRSALDLFGIDHHMWNVLISAVWPAARTAEAVMLALAYCKSRNLDPMKKMVHIVPVWDSKAPSDEPGKTGGLVETVWPAIAEIRVTASRTGSYGGKDAAVFGPDTTETFIEIDSRNQAEKEKLTLTYPEWCQITVYRIVQGVRCAFVGPKVYWKESYATKSRWSPIPNEMWADRKSGQLEKCAEAGALRAAFPEELGGEYAAEEMYGRTVEHAPIRHLPAPLKAGEVAPPAQVNSEFKRAETAAPAETQKPQAAKSPSQSDPRPEPPTEGVVVATAAAEVTTPAEEKKPEVQFAPTVPAPQGVDADWYADKWRELNACTKVGQVADLREEVEQELPPDCEALKDWGAACEARQAALQAARKPK